jgi:hypothetical protein
MIVPGSAGFDTVLRLLTGQIVSGIDAGFDALVTAMSIAYDSSSRVADSGEDRLGPARVRRWDAVAVPSNATQRRPREALRATMIRAVATARIGASSGMAAVGVTRAARRHGVNGPVKPRRRRSRTNAVARAHGPRGPRGQTESPM